jgi:hypothetical protein
MTSHTPDEEQLDGLLADIGLTTCEFKREWGTLRTCVYCGEFNHSFRHTIKAKLSTHIKQKEREAEVNGRRIQAEATLDKWRNDETSVMDYADFLEAQVEAWRFELQQPADTKVEDV